MNIIILQRINKHFEYHLIHTLKTELCSSVRRANPSCDHCYTRHCSLRQGYTLKEDVDSFVKTMESFYEHINT